MTDEAVPGRGPDATYCPDPYGEEGHHMVSRSTGAAMVKFVELCSLCGWIDGAALDRWAEQAIKLSMEKRAQRIAVAAETEPFSFVQSSDADLTLEEILFQALGAASMCWENVQGAGEFNSSRAGEVGLAMMREVNRALVIASRADVVR